MTLRLPPGRAGRLWLLRRLAVARRGHDVLEQKQVALRRRVDALRDRHLVAAQAWEETARDAETWWQRAALLAGERPLELACSMPRPPAQVRVEWSHALGVVAPAHADVVLPDDAPFPPGGSVAIQRSADAHRAALEQAAQVGATALALRRTDAELGATTIRLRALERRWIPEHERVLRAVELAIDEADREEASRIRWVIRRRAAQRRDAPEGASP